MAGRLLSCAILLAFIGASFTLPASQVSTSPGFQTIADRLKNAINCVDPCENFFEFACGGWKAANPVPPDATIRNQKTIYGLKREHIKKQLFGHFDHIDPTDTHLPRTVRQAKLLLDGCQANATSADWTKLIQLFDKYGGWPVLSHTWEPAETHWSIDGLAGHIHSHYLQPRGSTAFWSATAHSGSARTRTYKLQLQPGTGDAPQFDKPNFIRIAREIARDAGLSVPDQQILDDATQLELVVARLAAIYHDSSPTPSTIHLTIDAAKTRWPYVNWVAYFSKLAEDTLPISSVQSFEVKRPSYFDLLAQYYPTVDARVAQNLLVYQIAMAAKYEIFHGPIETASETEQESNNADLMQLLPDAEPETEPKARSQKEYCQQVVGRHVTPSKYLIFALFHAPQWNLALPEAHRIVRTVQQAWQDMLQNVTWLQESGKAVAKEKVHSVRFSEFGFDPSLFDENFMNTLFGGLQLEADNNGKIMAGLKYGRFRTWQNLRQILAIEPHDFGHPLTVNSFYSLFVNKISMPAAGMLSEPYFEYGYPKATNYAGLGFTVGHEIGHGFDPSGIHHGPHGHFNGWVDSSIAGFNQMEACMKNEYDHYCYTQDGQTKCIDGHRSAPDNTADNAGIAASFGAYKARIAQDGPEPRLPGEMGRYSMEQIFFMSFGYTYCRNTNRHWFDSRWQHKAHAPQDARAMIPNMNFDGFYKTFNCPAGSHMRPAQPCRVWN